MTVDPSTPNFAPWFHTTPEAILRAESILLAFHENRTGYIGDILAADYSDDPPPGGPVALLVALVVMCDRLADYAASLPEHEYGPVVREAARVVAQATIEAANG